MISNAPPNQVCMAEGCSKKGEHPAPSSNKKLKDYIWLCTSHIRKYNRNWNYYIDKSSQEVENDIRSRMNGGYPTWSFSSLKGNSQYNAKIKPDIFDSLNLLNKYALNSKSEKQNNSTPNNSFVPSTIEEKNALKILQLTSPVTYKSVNKRFIEIAKSCHPDITSGLNAEKRQSLQVKLQQASNAYSILKSALA